MNEVSSSSINRGRVAKFHRVIGVKGGAPH